ncbi:hypothetical protein RR46_11951 [Papilio xuthus]|uniref:Uncharacterized protein n=1 Tax=Papilio xuthus TaxID=66420 RepID=A0A194PNQ4_PAPXU|nr:hypothetical protein RR46_11951 [Papilio xuthus]
MFKSCCARPTKKLSKSKSKPDMASLSESIVQEKDKVNENDNGKVNETDDKNNVRSESIQQIDIELKEDAKGTEVVITVSPTVSSNEEEKVSEGSVNYETEVDDVDQMVPKREMVKKRYSVDYKKSRMDFKRFSVDCSRNVATLEELANLEKELARTNVDVRPAGRRKSTGILKSTTSSNDIGEQRSMNVQEVCSDDDEVFEKNPECGGEQEGPREPPATPVGRDELALRRHRFFSDLVCAARAAVEHRVRFDPLGPVVADGEFRQNN